MRIWVCEKGVTYRARTLCEALRFEGGMAAFVGGGGKSSVIAQLAREMKERKKRVVVTTTTHIALTEPFYDPEDEARISEALARTQVVTAGRRTGERRLSGGSEEALTRLRALCDVLLIEADGAHMRPFKAPEAWEPVLPAGLDIVVGVAGASALGRPIGECHRPQRVAALCGKAQTQLLTPQDMALVLQSRQGQKKDVQCRYEIVINQADDGERLENALRAAHACTRAVLRGRERTDAL